MSLDSAPSVASALRICVVENHADTRNMLVLLLEVKGYEVGMADSVATALALFDREDFDILLSDIGLPDGNGWDLLAALHRAGRRPHAIAMSGYGTAADVARSEAAGFSRHLVKPVDFAAIAAAIEQMR